MEQQLVGESDDFQESGTKEKEILKRKITMDDALEDEICILYDLFVEVALHPSYLKKNHFEKRTCLFTATHL